MRKRIVHKKGRELIVARMIVWVGEYGKYYWSRKIYWFLILNILK